MIKKTSEEIAEQLAEVYASTPSGEIIFDKRTPAAELKTLRIISAVREWEPVADAYSNMLSLAARRLTRAAHSGSAITITDTRLSWADSLPEKIPFSYSYEILDDITGFYVMEIKLAISNPISVERSIFEEEQL